MTSLSILLLLLPIGAVFLYNRLIRERNRVFQAWSDIAVQLKRRRDLIPKLVEAVRAYADYERSTIEVITRLRGEAEHLDHPGEIAQVERDLGTRLRKLVAVAEAYPDLKSSEQFLTLLRQLSEVEDHIQFARRYYNGSVRNLNVRIDSFPDLLLARPLGFTPAEFFELENPQDREAPEIA